MSSERRLDARAAVEGAAPAPTLDERQTQEVRPVPRRFAEGTWPGMVIANPVNRRLTGVMSWQLHTVSVWTRCGDAANVASERKVRRLPVVERGLLVGMVCTCDLIEARPDAPVALHMRSPAVAAHSDDMAFAAAELMRTCDVGALPVLHRGFLIGIVTSGDLERANAWPGPPPPRCAACGAARHVRRGDDGSWRCVFCAGGGR
jgi:CBS-domain-containing membrane protein